MPYIVLCRKDQVSDRMEIDNWISEAGGAISIDELRELYRERFNFWGPRIISDEVWKSEVLFRQFVDYKIEDGMVSA